MALENIRLEVMKTVEKSIDEFVEKYLIPVEEIWQPTDLLPNSQDEKVFLKRSPKYGKKPRNWDMIFG